MAEMTETTITHDLKATTFRDPKELKSAFSDYYRNSAVDNDAATKVYISIIRKYADEVNNYEYDTKNISQNADLTINEICRHINVLAKNDFATTALKVFNCFSAKIAYKYNKSFHKAYSGDTETRQQEVVVNKLLLYYILKEPGLFVHFMATCRVAELEELFQNMGLNIALLNHLKVRMSLIINEVTRIAKHERYADRIQSLIYLSDLEGIFCEDRVIYSFVSSVSMQSIIRYGFLDIIKYFVNKLKHESMTGFRSVTCARCREGLVDQFPKNYFVQFITMAAEMGQYEIVQYILDEFEIDDYSRNLAYSLAAKYGYIKILDALFNGKITVKTLEDSLINAAGYGNFETFKSIYNCLIERNEGNESKTTGVLEKCYAKNTKRNVYIDMFVTNCISCRKCGALCSGVPPSAAQSKIQ